MICEVLLSAYGTLTLDRWVLALPLLVALFLLQALTEIVILGVMDGIAASPTATPRSARAGRGVSHVS